MLRFRAVTQIAAVVVLMSLLLTACRVPEAPPTAYPQVGSYPGPRPPTRAATAVNPTAQPAAATPPPSPAPTPPPAGEAFTLTILHTGEVAGEVVPCG